jgi:16S rRNA (guanine527-N7)-methyltransferase
MHQILKYFPGLTNEQQNRFVKLGELYNYWNKRINVISRKDISNLYLHHILHSLSIVPLIRFIAGTRIADIGTGGGLPGMPLSIIFTDSEFCFIDSVSKKIKVVNAIIDALGLKNCRAICARAEDVSGQYDFITGRAVTKLPEFVTLLVDKLSPRSFNSLKNGIIYLKGGDVEKELKSISYRSEIFRISDYFSEPFFETKKIIYISPFYK